MESNNRQVNTSQKIIDIKRLGEDRETMVHDTLVFRLAYPICSQEDRWHLRKVLNGMHVFVKVEPAHSRKTVIKQEKRRRERFHGSEIFKNVLSAHKTHCLIGSSGSGKSRSLPQLPLTSSFPPPPWKVQNFFEQAFQ